MPFGSKNTRVQNKDLRLKFKDSMAIDYVRGGNPRCPSLIVGGLMLVLLFFACSWWSLTSQNFELVTQIENLETQLGTSGDTLEKCTQQKLSLEERSNTLQSSAQQQRVKYEQLKASEEELKESLKKIQDDLAAANKKISSLESSVTFKTTELESLKKLSEAKDKSLEALRMEKKTLNSRLTDEVANVESLRSELIKARQAQGVKPKDAVASYVQNAGGKSEGEDPGAPVMDHAAAAAQDENDAAENKIDSPAEAVAPAPESLNVDPREKEMLGQ